MSGVMRTKPAGKAKERVTEEKENTDAREDQENHREDVRKLVEMMQKEEKRTRKGSGAVWRLTWRLVAHTPRPCRSQKGKRRKI